MYPGQPSRDRCAPAGLCTVGETVIFPCGSRGKIIAVCERGSGTTRSAEYRFGTPGRIDLRHPSSAGTGHARMEWSSTAYSGGEAAQVRSNGTASLR